MTALTKARMSSPEAWNFRQFTLASTFKAYKGGLCALDLSTGKVRPASTAKSGFLIIGTFVDDVDATSADKLVNVRFAREINGRWYANSSAAAVVATDVGKLCYAEDDQTVGMTPAGAVAGRVWAVSSADGVFVESLASGAPRDASLLTKATLTAFAANNINVPDYPVSGTVFDVPATAGVSTITLPANADEGTRVHFVADGTKNGHTVQYRDATGPVSLTSALTASKRHQVSAIFLNGIWTASGSAAP